MVLPGIFSVVAIEEVGPEEAGFNRNNPDAERLDLWATDRQTFDGEFGGAVARNA
jgi:hypothetical protein